VSEDLPAVTKRPVARLLWQSAIAAAAAGLVLRSLVSGVGAELASPWANAFVEGIMLFSALLVAASQLLDPERSSGTQFGIERALLWPILGALGAIAIGILPAQSRDIALRTGLSKFAEIGFLVALLFLLRPHRSSRRFLLLGGALALVICGLGIYEALFEYAAAQQALASGSVDVSSIAAGQEAEFRARLATGAAVGPFVIANLLAGYLAMWLPLPLALAWRAWRRRDWRRLGGLLAVALFLGYGLLLTGSKGWIPALACGLWTLSWCRPGCPPRLRRGLIGLGAAGGVCGLAMLLWLGQARESYGVGLSLQVRLEYWQAGLQMFRESPLLGKGLNNYRVHYSRVKPARSEETRFAHNSLIQILADQGLLGLLVFGWFIAAFLWPRSSRAEGDAQARGPPGRRALLLGALCGLLLLCVAGGRYGPADAVGVGLLLAAAVALGVMLLLGEATVSEEGGEAEALDAWLRAGCLACLAVYAAHGLLDFSLHAHGLRVNAFLLLAAYRTLGPGHEARISGRGPGLVVAGLALAFILIWPSQLRRFGDQLERGRAALRESYSLTQGTTGTEAERAARDEAARERLEAAAAAFGQAIDDYPLGPEAYLYLASVRESQWRRSKERHFYDEARRALSLGQARDPLSASFAWHQARLAEEGLAAGLGVSAPEVLLHYQRAVELYPSHPRYLLRAGLLRARFYGSSRKNPRFQAGDLDQLRSDGTRLLKAAELADQRARLARVRLNKGERQQLKEALAKLAE